MYFVLRGTTDDFNNNYYINVKLCSIGDQIIRYPRPIIATVMLNFVELFIYSFNSTRNYSRRRCQKTGNLKIKLCFCEMGIYKKKKTLSCHDILA